LWGADAILRKPVSISQLAETLYSLLKDEPSSPSLISDPISENSLILIVEQDSLILEIIADLLHRYGLQAATAANGQVALDFIQRSHPKVILTGFDMPIMDGWRLRETLQNNPTTAEIPMIGLLTSDLIAKREMALSIGFCD